MTEFSHWAGKQGQVRRYDDLTGLRLMSLCAKRVHTGGIEMHMALKSRVLGVTALSLLMLLLACHKAHTPTLELEECDPAGYIRCLQPETFLSVPISDTNVFLTYSSRWGNQGFSEPGRDATTLGLGGWSLNLVQRYDLKHQLLISGNGTWRQINAIKLPSGETAVPSYDGAMAYMFDSAGRHLGTIDGHLGTGLVKVSYDGTGRILQVNGSVDGEPVHVLVQRDANGAPQALIGIDGGRTTLALDNNGRLIGITDPAGETTRIAWNSVGLVESETDPAGGIQQFTYDSSGLLASATDADGVTRRYERKASGGDLEINLSTAQGRRWTYRAQSLKGGIRRTFIGADGTENTDSTDLQGHRTVKLSDGTIWNIGAVAHPAWGMASPILTPIQQIRSDGISSKREIKYDLHPQTGLPYELTGSLTTNINGQAWTQHFDPAQRTADLIDPVGRRTVLHYDEKGRLLSYSAPGAPPVSYSYNAEGRRVSVTVGSGKLARTTRYNYDAGTGQITRTRPDGVVEKIVVNRAGHTVATSSGDDSTVLLGYDATGRVNQVQPPGGLNFTLGMSAAGRPTAFVPPMVQGDASIETSSYDKDGRLTAVSGLGDRAVAYEYDSAGRVRSSTFDQGKRTFSYDARSGLLTQSSDPGGVNISYGYTGGIQTSLTWSGPIHGSNSVALDANGRISREAVNGSNIMDFTYDPAGNLTGVGSLSLTSDPTTGLVTRKVLGVIETRQEFDEYKQLIHATTTAAGKLLLDVRYTRDALDRIQTVTETSGNGKTSKTEYSYDRADRLATVRVDGRATETYIYDPTGNRISLVRGKEDLKASYDDRDRLLSFGKIQYKWMPDGTLAGLAQGEHASAFVYDAFKALRQASIPGNRRIEYLVDADGRRVGRIVDGKLVAGYLYRVDGSIAAETDGGGKIVSRFGYDDLGHIALVERGGTLYCVITDTVGSPRLILESRTGAVVEQIAYDAWGNITRDSAPGFIPISFAGGLRDPETGLIRFGARDYDPMLGSWTGSDPIRFHGGDSNLYRYAASDPVNRSDRGGLESDTPPQMITVISQWTRPPSSTTPPQQGDNQGGGHLIIYNSAWTRPRSPDDPQNQNSNDGNPPQDGNPPTNDSPNNSGPTPWSCIGGVCPTPDPGPGGCLFGSCNNGPNGFNCSGLYCEDPNGFSCWDCSIGDPHLFVMESRHFDFQAAGEFVAASSRDGKLVVQSRQEPVLGGTEITFNTAVAANVNGDRVGVYAKEPSFLLVNGSAIEGADVEKRLPHGGRLQRHGATVNISWPDGTRLNLTRIGSSLNYGVSPSPGSNPTFSGLLGNSGTSDQLTGRDGSALSRSDPVFQNKLYRQFGDSWRIKQSESLFHYWPGESTARFTNLSIPSKEVRATSLTPETRSRAESICRAVGAHSQPTLDDCILDVSITGMPAFAVASIGIGIKPTPSSPSAPAASSGSTASLPQAVESYSIKIGDTVSPDHPSSGAGTIAKAGEKQTYPFPAQAQASVYVKVGPCDGAAPSFELRQSDDKVVGGTMGCEDFGPLALPTAGNYRIIASADGPSAHFTFTLRPTSFDQYSIKIGDTVSPDHPAPGAGIIKNLGQKQAYSFQGRAGDAVYLAIGPCEGAQPSVYVFRPDNGGLDGTLASCKSDVGRLDLPVDGTYRIVAETDKSNVFSRYGFSLLPVPPDQHFAVRLPVTVSPDHPARGAGRIIAKGEQQFYDFTATQGTKVQIEGTCKASCPNLDLRVTSVDEHVSFRYGAMALNNLKWEWTLPAGGKYRIQVRSTGFAGEYSFSASEVQPHH